MRGSNRPHGSEGANGSREVEADLLEIYIGEGILKFSQGWLANKVWLGAEASHGPAQSPAWFVYCRRKGNRLEHTMVVARLPVVSSLCL